MTTIKRTPKRKPVGKKTTGVKKKNPDMGPLVWVRILETVAGDRYSFQFNEVVQIGEKRAVPWVNAGIAEFVPDPSDPVDPQQIAERNTELEAENAELRQKIEDLHKQVMELTTGDDGSDAAGAGDGGDDDLFNDDDAPGGDGEQGNN